MDRLLAALKDADLVFTAKIVSSQQGGANALSFVTFQDAKVLRGRLPQQLKFRLSHQKANGARMHLTKGDKVLVVAKQQRTQARAGRPGAWWRRLYLCRGDERSCHGCHGGNGQEGPGKPEVAVSAKGGRSCCGNAHGAIGQWDR